MNLRLKTFGLALVALVAFSAVAAPGASATAKNFRGGTNPTFLTGTKIVNGEFELPGTGVTSCTTENYSGQVPGTATEVEATATYAGCTTSGVHTIVDMNNCKYVFTLHTSTTNTTAGGASHFHGPVHVKCPAGSEITLTVTAFGFNVCTVHIPPQTPTSPTVDYKVVGAVGSRDVEITSTVSGVTAVTTNTGGGCASGVHHNGVLRSSVTVKGFQNAAHTVPGDTWVE